MLAANEHEFYLFGYPEGGKKRRMSGGGNQAIYHLEILRVRPTFVVSSELCNVCLCLGTEVFVGLDWMLRCFRTCACEPEFEDDAKVRLSEVCLLLECGGWRWLLSVIARVSAGVASGWA